MSPRVVRGRSSADSPRAVRVLGAPALFAVAMSSVGASVYFALGVVAEQALALTPAVFLLAGIFLVLAVMTYVEGSSIHPERGGASTFARYAFDELWSFVAGWAILLDYLIVMAIAATAVPHYLAALWPPLGGSGLGVVIALSVLAWVSWRNVRGVSAERIGFALRLALLNLALLTIVVVSGLAVTFDPGAALSSIDLGTAPTWTGLAFAAVVATVAVTGVESASGLAGEVRVSGRELRRVVAAAAAAGLLVLGGVSLVAVANGAVVGSPGGLGGRFLEAPVLATVSMLGSGRAAQLLAAAVALIGGLVLVQAVNASMLGLSRLSYSLATNRQIPTLLGRLHSQRSTPFVAIVAAAAIAAVLVLSAPLDLLLGMFAFGAMLAFTIAHVAVIVLRFREPDRPRAYRIPLSVSVRGGSVPLPAVLGASLSLAAWVSVILLHEGARIAGLAWMAAGLAVYVVYRRRRGQSLARRFTLPAEALREAPEVEYGSILVPVFGRVLDDDIVGTAGRLAADESDEGEGGAMIEALYVLEVPMSLPLEARVPEEQTATGRKALARAKEVGEEYEDVEVATALLRGRSTGAVIVSEAKRRGVEAIVLAAEEPTRVRGGTRLGGRARPSDRFAGEVTKYVVEKAPCRVILTAPAAEPKAPGGDGRADGDDGAEETEAPVQ